MLAAPVTAQSQFRSGPRPIDLGRDVRPVLSLLNLSFGPLRDEHGRIIADRFSLSQSASFARRLSLAGRGFIPGFVWEESGQIVGNVTLLEAPISGRYLVANVAVHPDFRRRGIARGLMNEVLAYVRSQRGHQILLQVETDNGAALDLYRSMAFQVIGNVKRWQASINRLVPPAPDLAAGPLPRALRPGEWRQAYELDVSGFDPRLNWPGPPASDYYKKGFLRRASDLLNGRHQETHVIARQSSSDPPLIGLSNLSSEWGRPHYLRLCVDPAWQGQLEGVLLKVGVDQLRRMRAGHVWLIHPDGAPSTAALFEGCGFHLRRSLTVMQKHLDQPEQTALWRKANGND